MQEAYIVAGYRTAVTKSKKGGFRFTRPDDLAVDVIKGLMATIPQLEPDSVDDCIVGNAVPEAEQGLQELPVREDGPGHLEGPVADVTRRPGEDTDERGDERGDEGRDQRAERGAHHDGHRQVDDVAAQQELLEAVHVHSWV